MADDSINVAAAFAELRGDMREGFARIEGQLSLLVHAQQSTAQDVSETNARVTALDARVTALEERRWPLGPLVAVASVVAALAALGTWLLAR